MVIHFFFNTRGRTHKASLDPYCPVDCATLLPTRRRAAAFGGPVDVTQRIAADSAIASSHLTTAFEQVTGTRRPSFSRAGHRRSYAYEGTDSHSRQHPPQVKNHHRLRRLRDLRSQGNALRASLYPAARAAPAADGHHLLITEGLAAAPYRRRSQRPWTTGRQFSNGTSPFPRGEWTRAAFIHSPAPLLRIRDRQLTTSALYRKSADLRQLQSTAAHGVRDGQDVRKERIAASSG